MYVLSLIFFMVLRCNGCFASLAQVTTLKHILIWLIFIFLTFFSEGQSPNSRTRTLHLKTCFFYNLHLGLAFPRMIRPLTFWPVACSFYNYISNNLPSGLIMLIVLNHKWFNYIAYTCAYILLDRFIPDRAWRYFVYGLLIGVLAGPCVDLVYLARRAWGNFISDLLSSCLSAQSSITNRRPVPKRAASSLLVASAGWVLSISLYIGCASS